MGSTEKILTKENRRLQGILKSYDEQNKLLKKKLKQYEERSKNSKVSDADINQTREVAPFEAGDEPEQEDPQARNENAEEAHRLLVHGGAKGHRG